MKFGISTTLAVAEHSSEDLKSFHSHEQRFLPWLLSCDPFFELFRVNPASRHYSIGEISAAVSTVTNCHSSHIGSQTYILPFYYNIVSFFLSRHILNIWAMKLVGESPRSPLTPVRCNLCYYNKNRTKSINSSIVCLQHRRDTVSIHTPSSLLLPLQHVSKTSGPLHQQIVPYESV